jgi:ssDNA-specific exonuclease RecJ
MRHRRRGAGGPVGQRAPQTYRIIKFVVVYFELEFVHLTEGNIWIAHMRSE